jgi:hypothetical protein
MFLAAFSIFFPKQIAIALAICLFIKGLVFISNWISAIDLASGILLFITAYFTMPQGILIIAGIVLLQKGIFSLMSNG